MGLMNECQGHCEGPIEGEVEASQEKTDLCPAGSPGLRAAYTEDILEDARIDFTQRRGDAWRPCLEIFERILQWLQW